MLISTGDLVQLRTGIRGIVISKREVGAKNVVGRAGFVGVIDVLTEHGKVGRVLEHQLQIIAKK
jgi:hypothetical protein